MEGAGQQQAPQADFLAVFSHTLGFLCLRMMICAANCGSRRLRIPVFHNLEGMKNDAFFHTLQGMKSRCSRIFLVFVFHTLQGMKNLKSGFF